MLIRSNYFIKINGELHPLLISTTGVLLVDCGCMVYSLCDLILSGRTFDIVVKNNGV